MWVPMLGCSKGHDSCKNVFRIIYLVGIGCPFYKQLLSLKEKPLVIAEILQTVKVFAPQQQQQHRQCQSYSNTSCFVKKNSRAKMLISAQEGYPGSTFQVGMTMTFHLPE